MMEITGFLAIITMIYRMKFYDSKDFILNNPYPNPFNPSTQIDYQIPYLSNVEFIIFDINGRVLESDVGTHIPGYYSFKFDASNYASGIYFLVCKLMAKFQILKK